MLVMWNKKTTKKITKQLNKSWDEDAFYSRTVISSIYKLYVNTERLLIPLRKSAFNISVMFFMAIVGLYIIFPTAVKADEKSETEQRLFDEDTVAKIIDFMKNENEKYGTLPESADSLKRKTYTVPMTAYTSDPAQTDDTPCITASGLDVCKRNIENVVAANFLPIGTRVKIPELYGNRVFYVEDRMNKRYDYRMDIWMKDIKDARQFGLKNVTIEVYM